MAIPEKFKNLAEEVRNGYYGSEVREAIAESIEETGASSETAIKITEQLIDGSFDEAELTTEIEQRLEQLEQEYAPELNSVKSQLAERANFQDYEIQNKTRKPEALFTIIDDDGKRAILDYLRPLQQEFNIPMTTAIITNWVKNGNSEAITEQELLQLYNEGWEVSSHTASHAHLDALSQAEQEKEMQDSLAYLESIGITDVTTICYPFSDHNDDTVLAGRKFFRSGRTTDYGINRPPFQTWDIQAINGEGKEHTLESLKAEIDDISLNGGWGVYITHAGASNNATLWAREIIEYVLSKGNVEIVTYNEALNRMGNLIDVGRFKDDDKTKPHFVTGSDGSSSSNFAPGIFIEHPTGSINESMLPYDFKIGKIHMSLVQSSNNFPDVGYLMTNNLREGYAFQTLTTIMGDVYSRNEDKNEWSSWKIENAAVALQPDEVDGNTPISDFPNYKHSYCMITKNDENTFPPFSSSGVLETNRMISGQNGSYQIFRTDSTSDSRYRIFERRWVGGWTDWIKRPYVFSATSNYYRNSFVFSHATVGDMHYNTTMDQPMFINSNGDGFVDAMGNPITL